MYFLSTPMFSGPQWAHCPKPRSPSSLKRSHPSFFPPPRSSISDQEESSQWFPNPLTNLPPSVSVSSGRILAEELIFCPLAKPWSSGEPLHLKRSPLSIRPSEHWGFSYLWSHQPSAPKPPMAPNAQLLAQSLVVSTRTDPSSSQCEFLFPLGEPHPSAHQMICCRLPTSLHILMPFPHFPLKIPSVLQSQKQVLNFPYRRVTQGSTSRICKDMVIECLCTCVCHICVCILVSENTEHSPVLSHFIPTPNSWDGQYQQWTNEDAKSGGAAWVTQRHPTSKWQKQVSHSDLVTPTPRSPQANHNDLLANGIVTWMKWFL